MNDKKKIEAVLFSIGKEVSLDRLSELCDLTVEKIKIILEELKTDYGERDHSFNIVQRGSNYKLTVKDEFIPIVSKLVEGTDLDKALMETLAVIAWKYPVVQSEVIKLRNNKAYDHIKRLMELEFIDKERFGRTYKLKLTKKFFEYFDLPSAEAKKAFLKNVPGNVLKNAEDIDKEADEVELLVEQEKKEKATREEISSAVEEAKKVQEKAKEKAKPEEETESTEEESKEEVDVAEGVKLLFGE